MSVQTDCEMLSVQAMEAYARKYHISGTDVVKLFHENQVFEKMLIQHEYLHQVSFEEVLEFVEKIVMEGSKELVVYHGSGYEFDKIDLNKSHNRRDFGRGFYTTILHNTMETVQLYIANILTASEAVERMRYNKVNNQVSFHTEKALQYLQLVRRESYARNDI